MNTLKYKGFICSVDFSEEDNIFFGKVEGIDGLVNSEGSSVDELKSAFHVAVDDYLVYSSQGYIKNLYYENKITRFHCRNHLADSRFQ